MKESIFEGHENSASSISSDEITLNKRLGKGNYGEVYKGTFRGKEVAVKVIQHRKGATSNEQLSFFNELSFIKENPHPNIVQYLGACMEPNNLMIITEILPFGDLESFLFTNKSFTASNLSLIKRLRMALDTAFGMNWLHESKPQIIHRDLKISNLLVDENYRIKICDFGFAQVKHDLYLKDEKNKAKGTPLWTAPEIFRNSPFNEKCDIYSYGLIVWSLVTGKLPYSNIRTIQELLNYIIHENKRPAIDEAWNEGLKRLLRECWHADPSLRPSFSQIIPQLRDIILELSISSFHDRVFWLNNFGPEFIDREYHNILTFTDALDHSIRAYNEYHSFHDDGDDDFFADNDDHVNTKSLSPSSSLLNISNNGLLKCKMKEGADNVLCKRIEDEFTLRFGSAHYVQSSRDEELNLFQLIAETPERAESTSIERFGQIIKLFGPIVDNRTKRIHFLPNMRQIVEKEWFHGDISKEEATERLFDVNNSYLVRLSSTSPHLFTLSCNVDGNITHWRIERSEDTNIFSIGKYHAKTLPLVISKFLCSKRFNQPLTPCCGISRYKRQLIAHNECSGYISRLSSSTSDILFLDEN